ncbi:uncharacterized protein LOC143516337 [Brachyhypopomus gauderio]|uniref:uncharacterized protein LOC143516337 n=1 Tax=Brachyhypopomus gauderio TaxID=698409 RepID=UPI004040F7C5
MGINCEVIMSRISSSGVLLKDSAEAVIIPLKNGIISITRVYESLIDADVDPISGQCSNYTSIRQQIVETQQSLEESEQAASTGLRGLDQHIEKLTAYGAKLEQEISDTESTLNNLRTEQRSNEKLLKTAQKHFKHTTLCLNSLNKSLQTHEGEKNEANTKIRTGLGLTLIPVVGWVAGPVMATIGAMKRSRALHDISETEENVTNYESKVETYKSKVSDYDSKISMLDQHITQKHKTVEQIHEEMEELEEQKEGVAEFQSKVRRVVQLLSGLSGKTRVAEGQTRWFILQEPVMKMMEDVMKAAEQIAGNELLCTEDIPQLISTMRENHQRLLALCTSHSDTEDIPQLLDTIREKHPTQADLCTSHSNVENISTVRENHPTLPGCSLQLQEILKLTVLLLVLLLLLYFFFGSPFSWLFGKMFILFGFGVLFYFLYSSFLGEE